MQFYVGVRAEVMRPLLITVFTTVVLPACRDVGEAFGQRVSYAQGSAAGADNSDHVATDFTSGVR
jgi:hypothetical protein